MNPIQQENTTGLSSIDKDITNDIAKANSSQYLTFELSGETYGIDILEIKEIVECGTITRVPMSQGFVAGVINLRGSVVPVIDLAQRFSLPSNSRTKKSGIVIIEIDCEEQNMPIGITVDLVNEVLEIFESDVKSAPSFGTNIRTDFISGIVKMDEQLLVLLDVANILSVEELSLAG